MYYDKDLNGFSLDTFYIYIKYTQEKNDITIEDFNKAKQLCRATWRATNCIICTSHHIAWTLSYIHINKTPYKKRDCKCDYCIYLFKNSRDLHCTIHVEDDEYDKKIYNEELKIELEEGYISED